MRRTVGGFALASIWLLVAYQALAAEPEAAPGEVAGLSRQVTPPPAELLSLSQASVSQMDAISAGIRDDLRTARAARDVVKTLCLGDKLTQVDVAIRAARERRQTLELAAARGDAEQAAHEFTIVSVLRQRADAIRAEANQCIGAQDLVDEGKTATDAFVDPDLPEDPDAFPGAGFLVEPPSCVSCFR